MTSRSLNYSLTTCPHRHSFTYVSRLWYCLFKILEPLRLWRHYGLSLSRYQPFHIRHSHFRNSRTWAFCIFQHFRYEFLRFELLTIECLLLYHNWKCFKIGKTWLSSQIIILLFILYQLWKILVFLWSSSNKKSHYNYFWLFSFLVHQTPKKRFWFRIKVWLARNPKEFKSKIMMQDLKISWCFLRIVNY